MKRVMVFGTFDIFHAGHESYLHQAREHGDFLIVVVARDKTVADVKKQLAKNQEQVRLKNIKLSGLADEVVLGDLENKYAAIEKYRPDVIALGYDQQFFIELLEQKLKEFGLTETEIVRLKPFKSEIYKSSKLRGKSAV